MYEIYSGLDRPAREAFCEMGDEIAVGATIAGLRWELLKWTEALTNSGDEFSLLARRLFGLASKARRERVRRLFEDAGDFSELQSGSKTYPSPPRFSEISQGHLDFGSLGLDAAVHCISAQANVLPEGRQGQILSTIAMEVQSSEHILCAGAHGSLADGSFIDGLSDVDVLLWVTDRSQKDVRARSSIQKVARRINAIARKVDPTQHHGVFVVTESGAMRYAEHYLPIAVLEDVFWLKGCQSALRVDALRSRTFASLQALRLTRYLKWNALRMAELDYVSFREVLQVVQVLPCFVADATARPMKKERAIPWMVSIGLPNSELLGKLSMQRSRWGDIAHATREMTGAARRDALQSIVVEDLGGMSYIRDAILGFASSVHTYVIESLGKKHAR